MPSPILAFRRFLRSEDGPTAVEYAVMLAMITVVCLSTVKKLGNNTKKSVNSVSKALKKANK
jgi:pilus assembly protein Flp/PilA